MSVQLVQQTLNGIRHGHSTSDPIPVAVETQLWQTVVIVAHDSIGVLEPQRTDVGQPVESRDTGSSTEVEVGHRVQGPAPTLLLSQVPGTEGGTGMEV